MTSREDEVEDEESPAHALEASAPEEASGGTLNTRKGKCRSQLLIDEVLPHQYVDQAQRFDAATAAAAPAEEDEPECAWEAYTTKSRLQSGNNAEDGNFTATAENTNELAGLSSFLGPSECEPPMGQHRLIRPTASLDDSVRGGELKSVLLGCAYVEVACLPGFV